MGVMENWPKQGWEPGLKLAASAEQRRPKFYPVHPETGEAMDELYHLREQRDSHRAVWGGVCAACQRTFPCNERKTLTDAVNARQSQRRERLHGVRERRPYKRSDIPTAVVLAMLSVYGLRAFEVLCETFPWKIVWRAFQRDMSTGLLECGTSELRPWLTPNGKRWLQVERYMVIFEERPGQ